MIKIKTKLLNENNFNKYGTAILKQNQSAPKVGENWDCWGGIANLGTIDANVGIVETRVCDKIIHSMEAHGKPELLIPINSSVIQPVSIVDDKTSPNPYDVEAFVIRPGEAIVMNENVWHCAAMPVDRDAIYYFVGHSEWDGPGTPDDPWFKFRQNEIIKII